MRIPAEPQLHRWKLAPRPAAVAEPVVLPELPPPAAPEPPGVLEDMGPFWPAGETEFAYLYRQLGNMEVAVGMQTAGDTMTGTLVLDTEPDVAITFQDRFTLETDNSGTPAHTVSGPNLTLTDIATDRIRLIVRSIGQTSLSMQDESLANNTVSHCLQLHRKSTGVAQTAAGFGTGIQVFATDVTDTEREFGNLQWFWMNPTTQSSAFAVRVMTTGTNSVVMQSIPSGHILVTNRLLTTGGLGVGNSVAATTLTAPGTVLGRIPVYDDDGTTLLGSVPFYSAGSFS